MDFMSFLILVLGVWVATRTPDSVPLRGAITPTLAGGVLVGIGLYLLLT
jgi:hypothetical protein